MEDNIFSNFNSKDDIQEFLKKYLKKNQSVLLAWGSKGIFKVQILNILDELKKFKNPCFGYLNTNKKDKIYYYHPLKRGGEWLDKITLIELLK